MLVFVFFSSRRRHTRCALVTGVQTCALPICFGNEMTVPITPLRPSGLDATAAFVDENRYHQARTWPFERDGNRLLLSGASRRVAPRPTERLRSEARRVGQECVSKCRSRWSPTQ